MPFPEDLAPRPTAVIAVHRSRSVAGEVALVLVPRDVTEENAESFARFCRAHLKADKLVLLKAEDGQQTVMYSEVPLEDLPGLYPSPAEFPVEKFYRSYGDRDHLPTWPTKGKQN